MRECAGEREGEWRPRGRLCTGEPARAPLPSLASWWPLEGGGAGSGPSWDGPGRGMVGEGAFPAAAPSAAIGLVAFRDELSRIGFQLQPPGRPGRRGAGGGRGGGGGGGGCSIQCWPPRPASPAHKGAQPLGRVMSAPQPRRGHQLQPPLLAPRAQEKTQSAPGASGRDAARER